ncbi:hypothetical protein GPECTOR_4g799 [Gonium pectorale]|uniref:Bidirectional sugar transporter SWEET n=1 Tax=Gonium pectorale TaxID=33097 RepID=A0A150GZG7_GONPE|nr:hypothetical protein GPECTOR_4g799 [Gonium pectorale]|eukprot:KXZ54730.1 hypothetical protein GPECTOR_4g799 [Gonium pectorale]
MGVFTEVVVPIFGNILGVIMLLSPTPAVLNIRKTGKLGDINPLPYPMTAVNCIGWVTYAFSIPNPAILPANVLGFVAGVFFTMVALTCAPRKDQDRMTAIAVAASLYFIMLGTIGCWGLSPKEAARMWGTSAVVILMIYYFVPLSTMVHIVRTRNAASIYPPLAGASIANGTLWLIYGLAVQDVNIWLPNGFGTIIGVVQLGLRFAYGARPTAEAPSAEAATRSRDEEVASGKVYGSEQSHAVEGRTDSGSQLLAPGTGPGPSASTLGLGAGGAFTSNGVGVGGAR